MPTTTKISALYATGIASSIIDTGSSNHTMLGLSGLVLGLIAQHDVTPYFINPLFVPFAPHFKYFPMQMQDFG